MRKSNLLFLLLCFVNYYTFAQSKSNVKFNETKFTKKYKPKRDAGMSHLKVNMNAGQSFILNPRDIKKLKNQTIVGVDLVYTDFPKGADLSVLNRERLRQLYKLLPEAFSSSIVHWRKIKQTNVNTVEDMNKLFHGFVIYYRKMPSFEDENKLIKDIVSGKVKPTDSTLLKVFKRNDKWKDMLVVCDVTGSMSPYTAQLLLWISANNKLKTFKEIVFFNDNEQQSNNQEEKLDEEGIWTTTAGNSEKIMNVAFEAMQKGGHDENDLEAICYAIKKYPENKKNIVLIADNWEDPCDMQLLEYLKKNEIPVRVIVCGVSSKINLNLIELAHATGGSIHTMEQDLNDVAKIGEGQEFTIGKLKIKMVNGKFVQL